MTPDRLSGKKQIIPLPFPIYWGTVLLLSLIGLSVSVYLAISHYRVYTDIGYISFCAISKSFNCDTVSQSPYAILLGVPVSVWGIFGYLLFGILVRFAARKDAEKKRLWPVLFLISLFFSIYSIALALISTLFIRSYCIMCIATYLVNFFLVFYTWLTRRRFDASGFINGLKQDIIFLWSRKIRFFFTFSPFLIGIVIAVAFYPKYWNLSLPSLSFNTPKGLTPEGYPWIGGENPEIIITEFSDYLCFQCKKNHYYLRQLIEKYPDKIRLIHRHYPMDHEFNPTVVPEPFHVGSGKMALLSIYAAQKGKFWEMNDALFTLNVKSGNINLKELAEKVGIARQELAWAMENKLIQHRLSVDMWEGMKLNITGTPAYILNDTLYLGQLPPDIIKKVLN